MITFKHKSNSKRINIRTSKKLDERMSHWLQKVFAIKNQIIGFKSSDSIIDETQISITMSRPFTSLLRSFTTRRWRSSRATTRYKSAVSCCLRSYL